MGEFFRPWRRKAGCVTLVLTLVFILGWIRCTFQFDDIDIQCGNFWGSIRSIGGGIDLCRFEHSHEMLELDWPEITFTAGAGGFVEPDGEPIKDTNWFEYYHTTEVTGLFIPYWSITVPMTLLSAFLILWTGKRPANRPQCDQTPPEGP